MTFDENTDAQYYKYAGIQTKKFQLLRTVKNVIFTHFYELKYSNKTIW